MIITYQNYEKPLGATMKGEISLTVPNQSMTPAEFVRRYQSGQSIPPFTEPVYFEDDTDIYEWQNMSRLEQLQAASELKERLQSKKPQMPNENWPNYIQRLNNERNAAILKAEQDAAKAASQNNAQGPSAEPSN